MLHCANRKRKLPDCWGKGTSCVRTAARLAWVDAIRQVLETALSLLGVSAPQEMKRAESAEDAEDPQEEP